MINFVSLGHICINVDNIDEATEFYKELLGPFQFKIFLILKIKVSQKLLDFLIILKKLKLQ